jgi:hypothetical protein
MIELGRNIPAGRCGNDHRAASLCSVRTCFDFRMASSCRGACDPGLFAILTFDFDAMEMSSCYRHFRDSGDRERVWISQRVRVRDVARLATIRHRAPSSTSPRKLPHRQSRTQACGNVFSLDCAPAAVRPISDIL